MKWAWFLNLRNLPGRLTVEETAWFLGFPEYQISVLASRGLLKPLGQPVANAVKYYSTAALTELKQDAQWMSRATKEIMQHHRFRNQRAAPLDSGANQTGGAV